MKNSFVSSAVPNMRSIPRISTTPTKEIKSPTQNIESSTQQSIETAVSQVPSLPTLTGLESTEGNFASNYIPPNEAILAEYAFAEEIYKKNKRKYQHMLVAPAIQHLMIEGETNPEHSEILLKP